MYLVGATFERRDGVKVLAGEMVNVDDLLDNELLTENDVDYFLSSGVLIENVEISTGDSGASQESQN